jgi:hypothetical protein
MLGGAGVSGGIGVAICLGAALAAFILTYLWTSVAVTEQLAYAGRTLRTIGQEVETRTRQVVDDKDSRDAVALSLLQQQLSGSTQAEVTVATLAQAFKNASKTLVVEAHSQAEHQRQRTWISGPQDQHDRVIPVFRAVIECDTEDPKHMYYGSLAFALKNQSPRDFRGAIDAVSTAITIRGSISGWAIYEYVRAVCRIRLDSSEDAIVEADLRAAKPLGADYFKRADGDGDIRQQDASDPCLKWLGGWLS